MKKILYLLIFSFLLSGCNFPKKEVIDVYNDGKIATLGYFKNLNGKKILVKKVQFYNNSLKKSVERFDLNGNKDGKCIYWYPNGKKHFLITYSKNIKNGKYVVWYKNGKKQISGYYKNGLPDGKWKIYDQNGKLISVIYYDNGKVVSKK